VIILQAIQHAVCKEENRIIIPKTETNSEKISINNRLFKNAHKSG